MYNLEKKLLQYCLQEYFINIIFRTLFALLLLEEILLLRMMAAVLHYFDIVDDFETIYKKLNKRIDR